MSRAGADPEALVWVAGRVVPESLASVSAADRGFLFGDGLFETVRTRGGAAFRLERHLDRMRRGVAVTSLPMPEQVEDAVRDLLLRDRFGEGALRITLTRGAGARGLDPRPGADPTLLVSLRRAPPFQPVAGLAVRVTGVRVLSSSPLAGVKTLGYLPNVLALTQGLDDGLMLDDRGRLAQASAANVFWVAAGGELRTPSPACGILPGITREAVLELAEEAGWATAEGEWGPDELGRAREAFATSSLRGIAPIVEVDGHRVADGRPGEVTRALQAAYAELFQRETA